MIKNLVFYFGIVCMIGACANDPLPAPSTQNSDRSSDQDSKGQLAMTKEDAQRLAETHLALKQQNWGKVKEVTAVEDKFYVYYETPQRELRLLGPRALIVDSETRVVSFQRRR